jgi:hypothetical protein
MQNPERMDSMADSTGMLTETADGKGLHLRLHVVDERAAFVVLRLERGHFRRLLPLHALHKSANRRTVRTRGCRGPLRSTCDCLSCCVREPTRLFNASTLSSIWTLGTPHSPFCFSFSFSLGVSPSLRGIAESLLSTASANDELCAHHAPTARAANRSEGRSEVAAGAFTNGAAFVLRLIRFAPA